MAKKIIIKVGKKGEVQIEAKGFQGDECLTATRPFEEALGDISNRKRKTHQEIDLDAKTDREIING